MPVYEYECAAHGLFDEQRSMSEFDASAACPVCAGEAARVLSAPRLRRMAGPEIAARDRNERSAHEPTLAVRAKAAPSSGGSRLPAQPSHAPSRPWMLGHG